MPTMLLQPSHATEPTPVSFEPGSTEHMRVTLGDTRFDLALHWESPQGGWVRDNDTGTVYAFYFWATEDQGTLWLNGQSFTFQNPWVARERGRARAAALPASGEIKAPMPGSILKILAEPGVRVAANAPLLIMESMKMEMTLTAPVAGCVSAVQCAVGQLVEMNAVLVTLAPEEDAYAADAP